MWIVGITGRSGSGKSTVTAHYAGLGYPVADGDALSRRVTEPDSPCLAELIKAFGEGILCPGGTLDRKALARLAFASEEANRKLMAITHPAISREMRQMAAEAKAGGAKLFFLDGAMIVGGPAQAECKKLIVVRAGKSLSVSRIILRDGISKTAAAQRLAAQLPEAELLAAADYVIDNDGSQAALLRRADEVLEDLLKLWEGESSNQ